MCFPAPNKWFAEDALRQSHAEAEIRLHADEIIHSVIKNIEIQMHRDGNLEDPSSLISRLCDVGVTSPFIENKQIEIAAKKHAKIRRDQ